MNDYLNRIAECSAASNRALSMNTPRTHSDAVVTVNEVRRVNFGMQILFICSQSRPFQHNRPFNFLLFPHSLCTAATSSTSSIVVSPAGNRAQDTSVGRKNILAYDVRVDAPRTWERAICIAYESQLPIQYSWTTTHRALHKTDETKKKPNNNSNNASAQCTHRPVKRQTKRFKLARENDECATLKWEKAAELITISTAHISSIYRWIARIALTHALACG